MGTCCVINKEELNLEEYDNLNYYSFNSMNSQTKIENKSEIEISEYLEKAVKEKNIEVLAKLVNDSTPIINSYIFTKKEEYIMLNKPKTCGEAAYLEILNIIENKIVAEEKDKNEDMNISNFSHKSSKMDNEQEISKNYEGNKKENKNYSTTLDYPSIIKRSKIINLSLKFLKSMSNFKKDVAILILNNLSKESEILKFITYKEVIKKLINHLSSLINTRYKSFSEHVIASLQIVRRIYVKKAFLKKFFIQNGGTNLLYEFLYTLDPNIIQEILYCIEDLIYTEEDSEYPKLKKEDIDKILNKEMIDILIKLNIEKVLIELLQDAQRNPEKYNAMEEELRRLFTIFNGKLDDI